jgi:hypothetical protein
MVTILRVACAAVLVVALASCAPAVSSSSADFSAAEPAPAVPEPNTGNGSCDMRRKEGITQTITTQINALKDNDFSAAYAMASPRFQSQFSQSAFEGVISGGYSFLLNASDVVFSDCLSLAGNTSAQIRVTVSALSGQAWTLVYQLVEGEDGWMIEAATLAGSAASNT